MDDESKDDAGNAPRDENAQLVAPRSRATEDASSQQAEDHRRQRWHEIQRQIAAAIEHERPLTREEVQEPLVGPRGSVRILVPVRGKARHVVRPVLPDAHRSGVEPCRRQGIDRKHCPIANQYQRGGGQLCARARPCEKKEEDVPETDLGQDVFESEVGLASRLRAEKDAQGDEDERAPDAVKKHAAKGLSLRATARDRIGK